MNTILTFSHLKNDCTSIIFTPTNSQFSPHISTNKRTPGFGWNPGHYSWWQADQCVGCGPGGPRGSFGSPAQPPAGRHHSKINHSCVLPVTPNDIFALRCPDPGGSPA